MKKNFKILAIALVLLLVCGLTACGGSELSLISCPEQGFTTKTDPSYTWETDEADGLYIYLGDKGAVPYVHISWFDEITSVDDARAYMSETVRPAMKEASGDGPFQASETSNKSIGGKKLPAGEYIYEEQGQQVEMLLVFDPSGEHTVVYQAKYLSGEREEALDALSNAIRNFKVGDEPKTANAEPDLLGGPDVGKTPDAGLRVISCPEQGFTTKAESAYPWKYVEGDGITIWTESEGSVPFVLIFQTDGLNDDPYRYICEEYTPQMQEQYGDDLLSHEEYEAYEIGGKKLPAGLYVYKNSQGFTLEMLRVEDSTGEYTVQYTAKYQQGHGEATLAALDTAIRNFKTDDGSDINDPGSNGEKDPTADKLKIVAAESKTVEYETYDNGLISMEIPKGWEVTIQSPSYEYVAYKFTVTNPKDGRYSLAYYRMFADCLMVDSEHDAQILNQIYGGYIAIEPATTESLFRVLCSASNADFEVIEDLGALPTTTGLFGNILHAKVTDADGNIGEGIFSASLSKSSLGIGGMLGMGYPNWVNAYGITAITAPEGELVNWEEPIAHCLSTMKFSEAYNEGYNNEWRQINNTSAIIADTYQDISDIITSGYEERQSTYDIISQKQSDATLGYERVYDTKTGEIYKAYNGFTDDISTDNYLSERYKPVTDDMYMEGIDGYIEK